MSQRHDRVEWAAGWSHDGVSPKDGSRLIWTDKIPGEEVPFVTSPSDPHVEITPKIFAWWVVSFRNRHVATMHRAAQLFRLTGETKYAEWAAGQMDFYADNYLRWEPARDGARLWWQTLTEAGGVLQLTEVVRNLGDYVAPERKAHWREKFFAPEVAVLNASYRNIHNIACAQRNAAAQVALLYHDEAMWREAIEGEWGIRAQVREGVTSDYLWDEQSLGYNGLVLNALTSVFTAAGIYGRAEEFSREMAVAENLLVSPTYYRFPNGHIPNPADNTGIPTAPVPATFAAVYRVFPTTLGLAAIAGRRDWDTLLDPPPAAPVAKTATVLAGDATSRSRSSNSTAEFSSASDDDSGGGSGGRRMNVASLLAQAGITLPPILSRNLVSSRMAILREGPWQVFFHYGQITRSHTESEALNFTLFYGDTDLTHDAGTAAYGSPLHLGYFTRGLAHNVPLLNGEGEDLGPLGERREWIVEVPDHTRPMRGKLLEYSEKPARVAAEQSVYRQNTVARRTLALDGEKVTDTAFITTTGKTPQALGLALHLQGKVRLPATFQAAPEFARGRPEPFTFWQETRVAWYHDRAEFDVDYGTVLMHVTLSVPGDFKLWHALSPDSPPKKRESFYLETQGTSATFTTTFEAAKR
jgi:hypothetical protein